MHAGHGNLGAFRQAHFGSGRLMHGRQDRVILRQPTMHCPGKNGQNNNKKTDAEHGHTSAAAAVRLGADKAWTIR